MKRETNQLRGNFPAHKVAAVASTPGTTADPTARAPNGFKAMSGPSLTFRARLLALNSVLTYGIATATQLIVTPVALRMLGVELFGAWSVIRQVLNYLNLADFRPFTGLKLTLGLTQHESDALPKQRMVGAALVIWLAAVPAMLGLAMIVLLNADKLVPVSPVYRDTVRATLAIGLFGSIVATLLALPNNILRGMNEDYRAVGLQAVLNVILAVASVGALYAGFGLPGLAVAALLTPLVSGVVQSILVRRYVPWFGVAKPRKADLNDSARVNGWLLTDTAMFVLVFSQDLVMAGIFLSLKDAAVLAVAGMAIRVIFELAGQFLLAGSPGVAGLWGRGEFGRIVGLRGEIHTLALGCVAIGGAGCLLLNGSFLELWVGPNMHVDRGGLFGLILLGGVQLGYRIEKLWMDFAREFRMRTLANFLTFLITLALVPHAAGNWGLCGFVWALALPRLILLGWMLRNNSRRLALLGAMTQSPMGRAVAVAAGFLLVAAVAPAIHSTNWLGFLVGSVVTGAVAVVTWFYIGLPQSSRLRLLSRFRGGS